MKKLMALMLAVTILFTLCACGSSNTSTGTNSADANANANANANATSSDITLELNTTYNIPDFADLTLLKIHTTDKLTAPAGSIYYNCEDGYVYVDFVFEMTNKSATAISSSDLMTMVATGSSGTAYSSAKVAVERGSDISMYENINPLEKVKIHCVVSVLPSEAAVNAALTFKDQTFTKEYTLNTTIRNELAFNPGEQLDLPDLAKIVFKSVSYTDDVLPSDTSSGYSHYEVEDTNNTFLVADFEITNYQSSGKEGETFVYAEVEYMNKYKYSGTVITEDDDKDGFSPYDDIQPLTTRRVVCKIEVPKTVTSNEAVITLYINGAEYVCRYTA